MKLFFKRISVYFLCVLIAYLPVQRVQAGFPVAAVVLDVIGGAAVATVGGHLVTKAICGLSPWAANDPVFACEAKTPKSTWTQKAKTSLKWGAVLAAAGFLISGDNVIQSPNGTCTLPIGGARIGGSSSECVAQAQANLENYYSKNAINDFESVVFLSASPQPWPYDKELKLAYNVNRKNHPPISATATFYSNTITYKPFDDQFTEDFWATSPNVTPDTWLPPPTTETPNPVHPDPGWFPQVEPKTQPFTPAVPAPGTQPYPKPLPETHPDYRPDSTPAPEVKPDYFPGALPGTWPEDWPLPGHVPDSPGEFPGEWPLPGSTPTPGTGTPTDPTTPTEPLPELPFPIPLPVTGPLTRTELEQVQAENFRQATQGLPEADFKTAQEQITQAMNDFIADKVQVDVPEFSFNPFGYFTFGGGSCIAFNFSLSIGGNVRSVTFDSHCPPFNDFVRPTLEWFLYLSTALHIYMIFTRTVRSL